MAIKFDPPSENDSKVIRAIMLVVFTPLILWAISMGMYSLATAFGAIGELKTVEAVIIEIHDFKHKRFNMIDANGTPYELIPNAFELKKYKVGDTLDIKFNTRKMDEAYIESSKHIIWGDVFGLGFMFLMGGFLYAGLLNKKTRKIFESKNWAKSKKQFWNND